MFRLQDNLLTPARPAALAALAALALTAPACALAQATPAAADAQDDARADAPARETWNVHGQATYIWQDKAAFHAPYTGPQSLLPQHETGYSFSGTLAFGLRAWDGGELYFDPEVVQGKALSGLRGLGGMTNGEQQKTSGLTPTFYRARLFLRQTWNLGGDETRVESDLNQLAGTVSSRRLVLTAGNLALNDVFDNNAYAHDARSQFMNWTLVDAGAFDFAADARGYSWGAALEYDDGDWVIRAGRFLQPRESNGLPLDRRVFKHYGDQVEIEHDHQWLGLDGKVRLLAFHNRADMASFRDALADALANPAANGGVPDIARVRKEHGKVGVGLNVEQGLAKGVAAFGRAVWNDGKTETYAFTEVERSLSAGVNVTGQPWQRGEDVLGVALVRNGLSNDHRAYLAAGGTGPFIGDGRLDYRPERIVEAYYRFGLPAGLQASVDVQHIDNPAYNRARGPVNVGSIRLHAQF